MNTGIELIAEERLRQINKCGHSAALDDNYKVGTLARAGVAYATAATSGLYAREQIRECVRENTKVDSWPWESQCFRVGLLDDDRSRIRELTKAGALIAAEIDKIIRQVKPTALE